MLKLEVGKEYIDECDFLYKIFFYDKEEDIFYARLSNNIYFVRTYKENGEPLFREANKLIKEHKELIKKSIAGWLNYSDNAPEMGFILDILTGKNVSAYFYRTKKEAQSDMDSQYPKTMKFEINFKQLED